MYSYVAFRYIALVVCLALLHQDTVAGLLDWNDGVVSLYQVSSYAKRLTDIFIREVEVTVVIRLASS